VGIAGRDKFDELILLDIFLALGVRLEEPDVSVGLQFSGNRDAKGDRIFDQFRGGIPGIKDAEFGQEWIAGVMGDHLHGDLDFGLEFRVGISGGELLLRPVGGEVDRKMLFRVGVGGKDNDIADLLSM